MHQVLCMRVREMQLICLNVYTHLFCGNPCLKRKSHSKHTLHDSRQGRSWQNILHSQQCTTNNRRRNQTNLIGPAKPICLHSIYVQNSGWGVNSFHFIKAFFQPVNLMFSHLQKDFKGFHPFQLLLLVHFLILVCVMIPNRCHYQKQLFLVILTKF